MRLKVSDHVELNVQVEGRTGAPTLLMMHSIGCDLSLWDAQIGTLGREFQIVRYDARGHGSSDVPPGDYTVDALGGDALSILDAVGADSAYFCGLSLGGTTAQWLALNAPYRMKGMIIANTGARIGTSEAWQSRADAARSEGMGALAPTAITRFFSEQFRSASPAVVENYFDRLLATNATGYAGCCAVLRDADFSEFLSEVTVPTIVIGGALDVPTPAAQAQELADRIPGARLFILDAGHLSSVEAPDEFSAAVMQVVEA